MYSTKVKELTLDAFKPYGCFANLIDPQTEAIGNGPTWFHRDILPLDLKQTSVASFSICRVVDRPLVVEVAEYHNHTTEGIIPLDGDIVIHVGVATTADVCPVDRFEAFRVPKGTMVTLKPGVWHHAPFTANGQPVNTIIVLPERTYVNDCIVWDIEGEDRTEIQL